MESMSFIQEWGGKFVVPIPELKVYDPIPELRHRFKKCVLKRLISLLQL